MELKQALAIWEEVKSLLGHFCERIEVAGSIRRNCPYVHDIDIVLMPSNQGQFLFLLQQLGKIIAGGQKVIRVDPSKYGIPLDIYIATPETWATLLLVRTGSKVFNMKIASSAQRKNWHFNVGGDGFTNGEGKHIHCETEADLFKALGMAYIEPEQRS